jgi:uncharacterized membrane protein YfcA
MARKFDPNNLTAGDVFGAVAPTIAAIGAIVLVNKYFPDFVGLAVVALIVLVMFVIWTMPKKDLDTIAEAEHRQNEKIKAVRVVGPVLGVLRQVFGWLSTIIGVIMFIWLVYWAVGKAI